MNQKKRVYMKAAVLKCLGMIDILDAMYFTGVTFTSVGIGIEYGVGYTLIFTGIAIMAIPVTNLIVNRG